MRNGRRPTKTLIALLRARLVRLHGRSTAPLQVERMRVLPQALCVAGLDDVREVGGDGTPAFPVGDGDSK